MDVFLFLSPNMYGRDRWKTTWRWSCNWRKSLPHCRPPTTRRGKSTTRWKNWNWLTRLDHCRSSRELPHPPLLSSKTPPPNLESYVNFFILFSRPIVNIQMIWYPKGYPPSLFLWKLTRGFLELLKNRRPPHWRIGAICVWKIETTYSAAYLFWSAAGIEHRNRVTTFFFPCSLKNVYWFFCFCLVSPTEKLREPRPSSFIYVNLYLKRKQKDDRVY